MTAVFNLAVPALLLALAAAAGYASLTGELEDWQSCTRCWKRPFRCSRPTSVCSFDNPEVFIDLAVDIGNNCSVRGLTRSMRSSPPRSPRASLSKRSRMPSRLLGHSSRPCGPSASSRRSARPRPRCPTRPGRTLTGSTLPMTLPSPLPMTPTTPLAFPLLPLPSL